MKASQSILQKYGDGESMDSLSYEDICRQIIEIAQYDMSVCTEDEKQSCIRSLALARFCKRRKFEYTEENLRKIELVNELMICQGKQSYARMYAVAKDFLGRYQGKDVLKSLYVHERLLIDVDSMIDVTAEEKALYRAILGSQGGLYDGGIFGEGSAFTLDAPMVLPTYNDKSLLYMMLEDGDEDSPGLQNWNEGLDRDLTKDMHLCYAFHNLYDHIYLTLQDIIRITKFRRVMNVLYDIC